VKTKHIIPLMYTVFLTILAYPLNFLSFAALLFLLILQLLSTLKNVAKLSIVCYFTLYFSIPILLANYGFFSFIFSIPYFPLLTDNIGKFVLTGRNVLKGVMKIGYTTYIMLLMGIPIIPLTLFSMEILYTLIAYYSFTLLQFLIVDRELAKVKLSFNSYTMRVLRNDENTYELIVENNSRSKIKLHVKEVESENTNIALSKRTTTVDKNGKLTIKLKLLGKYVGKGTLKLKTIIADSTGIARRTVTLTSKVTVIPQYKLALRAALILLSRLAQIQTPIPLVEHKAVTGRIRRGEYYGVRTYVPGDEISTIHWKKSVSKQTLVVKDYKREPRRTLIILCDLTSTTFSELDDVVYTLLSTLIYETLRNPAQTVHVIIYDKNRTYLNIYKSSISMALSKTVKFLKETPLTILRESIKAKLEKPLTGVLKSKIMRKIPLVQIEISSLRDKVVENIGYRFLSKVINVEQPPANITFIHGNVLEKHIYGLLEHNVKELGYSVVEPRKIKPKVLYEKAKIEPIALGVKAA